MCHVTCNICPLFCNMAVQCDSALSRVPHVFLCHASNPEVVFWTYRVWARMGWSFHSIKNFDWGPCAVIQVLTRVFWRILVATFMATQCCNTFDFLFVDSIWQAGVTYLSSALFNHAVSSTDFFFLCFAEGASQYNLSN